MVSNDQPDHSVRLEQLIAAIKRVYASTFSSAALVMAQSDADSLTARREEIARFEKAYGQMPFAFRQDPVEAFRRHVWVSPYYEDDLPVLRDAIGAYHILFGSDFPHAEGLAEPTEFVNDLEGYSAAETRLVMRENGLSLTRPI